MATVRLTHTIRDYIIQNAADIFDAANPTPKLADPERDVLVEVIKQAPLYKAAVEHRRALAAAVPSLFLANGDANTREHNLGGLASYIAKPTTVTAIGVSPMPESYGSRPALLHLENSVELLGGHGVTYSAYHVSPATLGAEGWSRAQAVLKPHLDAVAKATTDQQDYRRAIRNLVNECTTVKQLLTAWPQAEHLMPRDVVQKHHAKVEKAKPVAKELTVDESILQRGTVSIVTAKLNGTLSG